MDYQALTEPLYLIDFNIDAKRAYYGARTGQLEKITRSAYVNRSLSPVDRQGVIERNAARIATRAFEGSILAGASAYHRRPVNGTLLLARPWGGPPVDLGGVVTVYFTRSLVDIGLNREVEHVSIEDDFGLFSVKRLADEMLIIKNFQEQRGRPSSTYLTAADLLVIAERSMRVLGDREHLAGRLESLARHHGLQAYQKPISAFLNSVWIQSATPKPLTELKVYWHKSPMATLSHDGHIWSLDYDRGVGAHLSLVERHGARSVPSFLASILPETGPRAKGSINEQMDRFKDAHRYTSNISVHNLSAPALPLIQDILDGELANMKTQKLEFTGRLDSSLSKATNDEEFLVSLQRNPHLPRISGMQVKLPAHLDSNGELSLAIDKPFTHIMKVPAGPNSYSTLGSMEWYSLTVAKMCGLNVEEFALVELEHRGPALLVERFDIQRDFNDSRYILAEDFWSIAGMHDPKQKYSGELIDVADAIIKYSTDSSSDGRHLLAQSIFSWLTFNSDMHLKNLLLLKEAASLKEGFSKVRLSPIYDVVCTQVYPNDAKGAAIALCGSLSHTLSGFRALGNKFGISTSEVDAMAEFLASAIPLWARRVSENLPAAIKNHCTSLEHIELAKALFDTRCMLMVSELDGAKRVRRSKGADLPEISSFSAEDINSNIEDHSKAETRSSLVPQVASSKVSSPRKSP